MCGASGHLAALEMTRPIAAARRYHAGRSGYVWCHKTLPPQRRSRSCTEEFGRGVASLCRAGGDRECFEGVGPCS